MKKILLFCILVIVLIVIWFGESRRFFCLEDGSCVTVWKTYNNACYIIPGKYYGIIKPSSKYIESSNTNLLTIYFSKELPRSLIVQCEQEVKINNEKTDAFTFYRYETDTNKCNNLLYLPSAKKRSDMKSVAGLMDIDIRENYALDKDGKKL
jgi:hypothetical protein